MRIRLILISLLVTSLAYGQIGGENTYEFMTLPTTARIAALGGNLITVKDDDVALAYQNPALLSQSAHRQLSFSHNFFFADISHGYAAYGHHLSKPNITLHGGVQYITYGDFSQTDPTGQITGTFKAAEYVTNVGMGYQYSERISLGANVKAIYSQLESYNSFGLATDLGLVYQDTSSKLLLSFVVKNLGGQLNTYAGNREAIPFDVQLGVSKQLRYLPFRVSIIAHDLYRWNIRYDDPNAVQQTQLFSDEPEVENKFVQGVDNFFQHIIFSGEFLLGKEENLRLRLGYNHQRRAELSVDNTVSFAGFSFGVGLKVKRFRIDFGRATYHLAGGTTHLSLSTYLGKI